MKYKVVKTYSNGINEVIKKDILSYEEAVKVRDEAFEDSEDGVVDYRIVNDFPK